MTILLHVYIIAPPTSCRYFLIWECPFCWDVSLHQSRWAAAMGIQLHTHSTGVAVYITWCQVTTSTAGHSALGCRSLRDWLAWTVLLPLFLFELFFCSASSSLCQTCSSYCICVPFTYLIIKPLVMNLYNLCSLANQTFTCHREGLASGTTIYVSHTLAIFFHQRSEMGNI